MPEVMGSSAIEDGGLSVSCESGGESWWTRREYRCHVVDCRSPESDHTLGAGRERRRRDEVALDRWSKIGSVAVREDGCTCT